MTLTKHILRPLKIYSVFIWRQVINGAIPPLTINGCYKGGDDFRKPGINKIEHVIEEYYPLKSVTGNAGKLMLFDTNMPHKAGIAQSGHVRYVARFDHHFPSQRPSFLSQRVKENIEMKRKPSYFNVLS
ncbi:hypothetical protein OAD42_02780 [Oceanospirillaceae bacterium]|nr:hypothetical protein [Oceanospirillaceae bacterium]